MSDFFRIIRGLEIDETVRVIQGTGAPGSTPDTDSSKIGSLYLDSLNGDLYIKYLTGAGPSKWRLASSAGSLLQLYEENPSIPTSPVATGLNSVAIGNGATALANNSIALGQQSLARHIDGIVQAGGRFASTGDAQVGRYTLRGHTINAFETEIFLDGTAGTEQLIMPDDSTWTFKATVTGHRTDADDGHAGFTIEGVIYRQSGAATTVLAGKVTKNVLAKLNRQWDVNVYADSTNGALKVACTGQAGKTIRWLALVETVEVTN